MSLPPSDCSNVSGLAFRRNERDELAAIFYVAASLNLEAVPATGSHTILATLLTGLRLASGFYAARFTFAARTYPPSEQPLPAEASVA